MSFDPIKANEALALTWRDDEADEYTRCVISSMVACSKNPSQREHAGPLSPDVCRQWAQVERDASSESPRCSYTADVLFALADKLHEVKS